MKYNKIAEQDNQLGKIDLSLHQKIYDYFKVKKIWMFVLLLIIYLCISSLWSVEYGTSNTSLTNIQNAYNTVQHGVKLNSSISVQSRQNVTATNLPKPLLNKLSEDEAPTMVDEFPYPVPDASTLKVEFLHKPKVDTCNDLHLLILVMSSLDHFLQRTYIRTYWKRVSSQLQTVKPIFMLGYPSKNESNINAKVAKESNEHNDILQGSFIDSYLNVTVKMINGFRWFHDDCRNAKFAYLTDDDVSINLQNLKHFLHKNTSKYDKDLLTCGNVRVFGNHIRVERSGKWAVPRSIYNKDSYPPYCNGACFLMSSDVVSKLYLTSRDMQVKIGIADVTVTGIIRAESGIELNKEDKVSCNHLGRLPNFISVFKKAMTEE